MKTGWATLPWRWKGLGMQRRMYVGLGISLIVVGGVTTSALAQKGEAVECPQGETIRVVSPEERAAAWEGHEEAVGVAIPDVSEFAPLHLVEVPVSEHEPTDVVQVVAMCEEHDGKLFDSGARLNYVSRGGEER